MPSRCLEMRGLDRDRCFGRVIADYDQRYRKGDRVFISDSPPGMPFHVSARLYAVDIINHCQPTPLPSVSLPTQAERILWIPKGRYVAFRLWYVDGVAKHWYCEPMPVILNGNRIDTDVELNPQNRSECAHHLRRYEGCWTEHPPSAP